MNGVCAQMRLTGVPFEAGDGGLKGEDAFVSGDDLHERWFADDG